MPDAQAASPLVVTPGGFRPRSLVHAIEPGHVIDLAGGRLRVFDPNGVLKADHGAVPERDPAGPPLPVRVAGPEGLVPELGHGWIVSAQWTNGTGTPVTSLTTTWTVPREPLTRNGQTVFLFNALRSSSMIYQPVLQWGISAAGGGDYWAVASWYADGDDGPAAYSKLERVGPGDVLVGVMTHTGFGDRGHSYHCQFTGIAHAGLAIRNVPELTDCAQALEAYRISRCSDYPHAIGTAMTRIAIRTGSATPAVEWAPVENVTSCGQSASIVSNSATSGEVDLHFRLWNPWQDLGGGAPSPVSAVSWSGDRLDLFVREADGAVRHKWSNGSSWGPSQTGWESLGGVLTGQPTAVSWGTGRLDLFGRAADGSVCHKWFEGRWGPSDTAWEGLGGQVEGIVTAVSWGPDRLDLFARGTDKGLWHSWWGGSGWGRWESLGGQITGTPAAVAWGPNRLDVFARGIDGGIARRSWDGTRWVDWDRLGGATKGSPAAVAWAPGRLDVFVRGTDDAVYHKWWDGSRWGPGQLDWEPLGGNVAGDLSAVSWAPGRLDVFAHGPNRAVFHKWFDATWGPTDADWEPLGGAVAGTVAAVSRGPNRLDLFARGAHGRVWRRSWSGTGWSPR